MKLALLIFAAILPLSAHAQDISGRAIAIDGDSLDMAGIGVRLKDRDGKKMSDAYLRERLATSHPWISPVYERTSDFVHLSGRHFDVSIARTDDETRMAYFQISGHDPQRPDETYFEVVDTFFEATKLASLLILAFLMARHQREQVLASMPESKP
ncbi:hypothetical protein ATE68_01320 [Sphingopyxis sp. H038]|nr:hypothetical protein ATE78_01320 [Sphingopyxis sp. H012]KTE13480.1 hypothetical protein ATE70_02105 [Sphingopyxis sp. H053]KTE36808.1 hypothetical protein ATE68_01320 [Sphingopyxis sp. H038]KTE47152.1 hypothetical protein ATE77_02105 [Sphingopyxis sp. H005]KTE48384.1 hypothetical protein ATE73_03985 [Sphingopyxis sp. H077]KTE70015.1 hypothetical protein ATE74_06540 [Sphingopyxis sp. H085]